MIDPDFDHHMMQVAARLALRGIGRVEPNPPVGCVIVDPQKKEIIAEGWHTHYGGPHAEAHALQRCHNTKGAAVYCTFEPCNHQGKTPPCTEALIKAGISRCVVARRDPNPEAAGGIERLHAAGIQTDVYEGCKEAIAVTDAFVKRVTTGLPYVTAKWAQTLDGKIATRTGSSQWISNTQSRAAVHRLRARADLIMTGIGTVLTDDPQLTARQVRRVHRNARRLVIDWNLDCPVKCQLAQSTDSTATFIATTPQAVQQKKEIANQLQSHGVEIVIVPDDRTDPSSRLEWIIAEMVRCYQVTNVLVEAGGGLIGSLLKAKLIDQIIVYTAPKILGDERAIVPIRGFDCSEISQSIPLTLKRVRQCGPDDVELIYKT